MGTVAGHTFDFAGRCACGRTWINCLDQRHRWEVGEKDIAHVGALNQTEVDQLHAYEALEQARIWKVTTGRTWEAEEEMGRANEP